MGQYLITVCTGIVFHWYKVHPIILFKFSICYKCVMHWNAVNKSCTEMKLMSMCTGMVIYDSWPQECLKMKHTHSNVARHFCTGILLIFTGKNILGHVLPKWHVYTQKKSHNWSDCSIVSQHKNRHAQHKTCSAWHPNMSKQMLVNTISLVTNL